MHSNHPSFIQPKDGSIKIWRYIDFTKLVSMLSTQSLYFTRSDKLGDPFEGSYPKINVLFRHLSPKQLSQQEREAYFKTSPNVVPPATPPLWRGCRPACQKLGGDGDLRNFIVIGLV